jgi:hypothetical protein
MHRSRFGPGSVGAAPARRSPPPTNRRSHSVFAPPASRSSGRRSPATAHCSRRCSGGPVTTRRADPPPGLVPNGAAHRTGSHGSLINLAVHITDVTRFSPTETLS